MAPFFHMICLCVLAYIPQSQAACSLPGDLTGNWFRPTDTSALAFSSSTISGLGLAYHSADLGAFQCDSSTGSDYILKTATSYGALGGRNYNMYFCWRLVRVTASAFMLYELSNELGAEYGRARGYAAPEGTAVAFSDVCARDASASSTFWTTLVKSGATGSGVKQACPSLLVKSFAYDRCSGSAAADFCTVEGAGVLNYTMCSTQIYRSAQGTVYCMGYVERSPYWYINLYDPGNGKDTTCLRAHYVSSSEVSTAWYSGDCTTASAGTVALTAVTTCPIPDSGSGDDSATVGAAAGGAVGGTIFLVVGAALLYYFVIKKGKRSTKVSDSSKPYKATDVGEFSKTEKTSEENNDRNKQGQTEEETKKKDDDGGNDKPSKDNKDTATKAKDGKSSPDSGFEN